MCKVKYGELKGTKSCFNFIERLISKLLLLAGMIKIVYTAAKKSQSETVGGVVSTRSHTAGCTNTSVAAIFLDVDNMQI